MRLGRGAGGFGALVLVAWGLGLGGLGLGTLGARGLGRYVGSRGCEVTGDLASQGGCVCVCVSVVCTHVPPCRAGERADRRGPVVAAGDAAVPALQPLPSGGEAGRRAGGHGEQAWGAGRRAGRRAGGHAGRQAGRRAGGHGERVGRQAGRQAWGARLRRWRWHTRRQLHSWHTRTKTRVCVEEHKENIAQRQCMRCAHVYVCVCVCVCV